ncbi:MAG: DUF1540 domain-containing protein [Clostridia bacterium]|nr:DUF1540 domain-containing protein [Clostridia bacterium]
MADCNNKISCSAVNCIYNDKNDRCTAESITVTPRDAKKACDTECDTFKCE